MLYNIGMFFSTQENESDSPQVSWQHFAREKGLSKAVKNSLRALPIKLYCECDNTASKILNVSEIVLILLDVCIEPFLPRAKLVGGNYL